MVNNKQLINKVKIVSGGSRGMGRRSVSFFPFMAQGRVAVNYSEEADSDYLDAIKGVVVFFGLPIH